MKYNEHVFLPVSAKGTSEVTQTAQFILRDLTSNNDTKRGIVIKFLPVFYYFFFQYYSRPVG